MKAQQTAKILLITGIVLCFTVSCIISMIPISTECNCNNESDEASRLTSQASSPPQNSEHKLAVLVPFRDRFDELLQFVPHISKFLAKQSIAHHIFVLNQRDKYRFNRASLINVGFMFTQNNYDYIAMHDVDLLPMNDNLRYSFPDQGPLHIASPKFHPKYHYETFVGGILLLKREHFKQLNGMSNKYWGWGLEDDEFYVRIKEAGLHVNRPTNITTGISDTFRHIHDRNHRKRDTQKCYNQKEVTRRRDHQTGLDTLKYKILSVNKLTIDDNPITVVNISLDCDRQLTPWCDCSSELPKR